MKLADNEELLGIKAELIEGMTSFIEDGDGDYSNEEIEKCDAIIVQFLISADGAKNKVDFMDQVKKSVLSLNELNASAGESLIETDQREQICEIVIKAGALKGYNKEDEDITEEWREW